MENREKTLRVRVRVRVFAGLCRIIYFHTHEELGKKVKSTCSIQFNMQTLFGAASRSCILLILFFHIAADCTHIKRFETDQ